MKQTEPQFITIGKILTPWEYNGYLKIEVITEFPERFAPGSTVYTNKRQLTIDDVVWRKGRAIVKFTKIDTEQDAQKLCGQLVEIHHSQLQTLPDGQFYQFQLIGLEVRTVQGEIVGKISDIMPTSGTDIYVINGEGGEILIPSTDENIKSIDLEKGVVYVEPVKGLLDLNKKAAK